MTDKFADCVGCKYNKEDGDYSLCTCSEDPMLVCPMKRRNCDPAVLRAYEEEEREKENV